MRSSGLTVLISVVACASASLVYLVDPIRRGGWISGVVIVTAIPAILLDLRGDRP